MLCHLPICRQAFLFLLGSFASCPSIPLPMSHVLAPNRRAVGVRCPILFMCRSIHVFRVLPAGKDRGFPYRLLRSPYGSSPLLTAKEPQGKLMLHRPLFSPSTRLRGSAPRTMIHIHTLHSLRPPDWHRRLILRGAAHTAPVVCSATRGVSTNQYIRPLSSIIAGEVAVSLQPRRRCCRCACCCTPQRAAAAQHAPASLNP